MPYSYDSIVELTKPQTRAMSKAWANNSWLSAREFEEPRTTLDALVNKGLMLKDRNKIKVGNFPRITEYRIIKGTRRSTQQEDGSYFYWKVDDDTD